MEGISINIVTASFFYILIKKFYFYDGMLLILSKLSLITTTVSLIEIGDKKTEKKKWIRFICLYYTTIFGSFVNCLWI